MRIAATFTAEPLTQVLESWLKALGYLPDIAFAPFNQVYQQLLDPASLLSTNRQGFNVLLVRPGDLGADTLVSAQASAVELASALAEATARTGLRFLLLVCPTEGDGEVEAAFVRDLGQRIQNLPGVTMPDFRRVTSLYPVRRAFDPQAESAARMPYTMEMFAAMATFLARSLAALRRKPFKVIAVDCDNTLWSGVCGEIGPRGVVIDESRKIFQRFLLARRAEGFLLCLVSKNNPEDVEAVFRENPEMIAPREAFLEAAVNWLPKSGNLGRLSVKLGLGLDSFLFLDDNPAEIAEVSANAPAVLSICLPEDSHQIPRFLEHLWVLDQSSVTSDDSKRADFYRDEARRLELRERTTSFSDFIAGLKMELEILPVEGPYLARASQLTQRTNQFNAFPRPLDEVALSNFCTGRRAEVVNVKDRFGDYGTVGLMACSEESGRAIADIFLLSCRALGKGVEQRMLRHLGSLAMLHNLPEVGIRFEDTGRNGPCRDFLESLPNSRWEGATRVIPAEAAANCSLVSIRSGESVNLASQILVPMVDPVLASRIAHELRTVESILEWCSDPLRPRPDLSQIFIPPKGDAEIKLASIWCEVLRLETVGRLDRFNDLGGTSLQLVRVHAAVQRAFNSHFDLVKLFENPSLAAQAQIAMGDREMPLREEELKSSPGDGAVAIIGMAVRLPGASTPDELWKNLREGIESVQSFDPADLEAPGAVDDPAFICARGLLDPEVFEGIDGGLFGILPREAEMIDPQHRVFLEICWEALERAGYVPDGGETEKTRVGVYAGCYYDTYLVNNVLADPANHLNHAAEAQIGPLRIEFGNDKDHLATRVAFKLNLKGPSVTVQTACSTSLVAVAHAVMALRARQSDMILAGGVTVTVPQKRGYFHKEGGMLSKDGHCRPFDAASSGTVFSNGGGVVVLKRLEDAVRDGDHIHAVLRGFGMNNDGGVKHSYAAPSSDGQADAITRAHRDAGIDPRTISYVEAHGTATPLGDPIEIAGLTRAFRHATSDTGFCAIGSLKSNLGHLDTAAGVCGLIKTVLSLENGELPPLLHFERPNPHIDFATTPFVVNDQLRKWQSYGGSPRRAGVSAFGVGGTNVHVVLEEAPVRVLPAGPIDGDQVLVFSGRDDVALEEMATRLATYAQSAHQRDFAAAARTLALGRKSMSRRAAVVADNWASAADTLQQRQWTRGEATGVPPELVWMFPGQGAQHPGMTCDLYAKEPGYRADIDHCAEFLRKALGLDLRETLFSKDVEAAERLKRTVLAQPAIFMVEYALARQWQRWGIQPALMLGHSVGEFTAACLSGIFTLEDGLRLLAARGYLMGEVAPGSMLSVRLPSADLRRILPTDLDIAAENGPQLCVVAGNSDRVAAFASQLEATGVIVRELHTSHAFHSRMMDGVVPRFQEIVSMIHFKPPTIPILSSVTGRLLRDKEATDPAYWASHLRQTVQFHQALLGSATQQEGRIYLEVGPGQSLTTLARQSLGKRAAACLSTCEHPASGLPDRKCMLQSLGELWCHGAPVDWDSFHGSSSVRRVPLPTYPFQRTRAWLPGLSFDRESLALTRSSRHKAAPSQAAARESSVPGSRTNQNESEGAALKCREVLEELSGIPAQQMPDHVSFLQLGFDSLLLTQAARELQNRFGCTVTFRDLMQNMPNIGVLAKHLESVVPNPVVAAPDKPSPAPADTGGLDTESGVSGPRTRIDRVSSAQQLSDRQRTHLENLVLRYNAKTLTSKRLTQEHRRWHADPRTVNGFNRLWKEMVYQVVAARMKGSRMWDVDGNEYIDMVNGFGPNFLGHAPDFITEAIQKQLATGVEIGPQCQVAMETAKLFCETTGNERVCFLNTGSEAVQAAMRIARTVTGRNKVLVFDKDYHGNFDSVLVRSVGKGPKRRTLPLAPGIPEAAVADVIVVPWGTSDALDMIRQVAHELAAVLVEPMQSRQPELMPVEFVREVKAISESAGFLLVFDEVITGLRQGLRGAQELYGIRADLATYGKIFGGGALPIGIVAGKAQYMDTFDGGHWQYGDDSFPEKEVTFFAGTFVRLPLAMAACHAVLTYLNTKDAAFWDGIRSRADRLATSVDRMFAEKGIDIRLVNSASQMFLRIGEKAQYGNLLFYHLREKGVFVMEGLPFYLTAAHTDQDIDFVIKAFQDSITEMQDGGFLSTAGINESPLPTENNAGHFPMTEPMAEIWLGSLLGHEANLAFNELIHLRIHGSINIQAVTSSIHDLVARHAALRMRIPDQHSDCFTIDATWQENISVEDFRNHPEPSRAVTDLAKHQRETPFDLLKGDVFRVVIAQLSDHESLIQLAAHHIACDGWSFGVILRDFWKLYVSKLEERDPLLPLAPSIVDRSLRQREGISASDAALDWWTDRFSTGVPELQLPLRHGYGVAPTYKSATCEIGLSLEKLEKLRGLAKDCGSTLNATLLAAYQILLYKLSAQDRFVMTFPSAGQLEEGDENLVGHCVNFLPLLAEIDPRSSFKDFVIKTAGAQLDALEHGKVTYGRLLRALKLRREDGRRPLMEIIFNLESFAGIDSGEWLQAKVEVVPVSYSNSTIFLNVVQSTDGLLLSASYNNLLIDEGTMNRWLEAYQNLLWNASRDPSAIVEEMSLLSPRATAEISRWSGNSSQPSPASVTQRFLAVASSHPFNTALSCNGAVWSYVELAAKSAAVASALRDSGVLPKDRVGIDLPRSPYLIASILGVLEAGACFVPVDPSYPEIRKEQIFEDAGVRIVLTNFPQKGAWLDPSKVPPAPSCPSPTGPEDPAYILFTSGSTGRPKGTVVPHRGIIRLVVDPDYCDLGPGEVILQASTPAFDAATFEIFGALLNGGKLVLLPEGGSLSDIARIVQTEQVTTLWLTAGLFELMVEEHLPELSGVRQLLSGGDVYSPTHAKRAFEGLPNTRLINGYGPTENTTFTACHTVQANDIESGTIPIGRPIGGTYVEILDPSGRRVPVGVPGELCCGGSGLALGYLGQERSEAFVRNPLQERGEEMIYRTGDLCRWRSDGTIEFIGRRDQQVKIRGFRIELPEIEFTLLQHPAVQQCKLVVQGSGSASKHLIAYYTSELSPDAIPSEQHLRTWLETRLPAYMRPDRIVHLPSLPLTTNGKIDIAALPKPNAVVSPEYREPESGTEVLLAKIWKELLVLEHIGRDDDFFDLGGNSLLGLRMFARISREFKVTMPLATLLRTKNIRALASAIDNAQGSTGGILTPPISQVAVVQPDGHLPPIFAIHGGDGGILFYKDLANRLPRDRPFYAVESPNLSSDGPIVIGSIEETAGKYIELIRTVRPEGPYLLAGYSYGGVVAFEMAVQLSAAGERVPFLALFDTLNPAAPIRPYSVKERFSVYWKSQKAMPFLARLATTVRRIRQGIATNRELKANAASAVASGPAGAHSELRSFQLREAHLQAMEAYTPDFFTGHLTLYRAEEEDDKFEVPADYGWTDYVEELEIVGITGGHLTMFDPTHVKGLARQFADCCSKLITESPRQPMSPRTKHPTQGRLDKSDFCSPLP